MPVSVEAEFRTNYERFKPVVAAGISTSSSALAVYDSKYLESYRMLCAFRGWHEIALLDVSEDVSGFFIEAHNDLLTSHLLAMNGMWRPAYISLRSFMENYLSFIYFKDHPIEFRLWLAGDFRVEPKDMRAYCVSHPDIAMHPISRTASQKLSTTYAKLSGSVHASRADFRMTAVSGYPALSTGDPIKLSKWLTQERDVVRGALVLFLALNCTKLSGAAHPIFRKVLSACLTSGAKAAIRSQLSIAL